MRDSYRVAPTKESVKLELELSSPVSSRAIEVNYIPRLIQLLCQAQQTQYKQGLGQGMISIKTRHHSCHVILQQPLYISALNGLSLKDMDWLATSTGPHSQSVGRRRRFI